MAKAETKKAGGRTHRATYARDKRKGGYLIRVVGPYSNRFAGRVVPVTMKDGSEQEEALERLIWSGTDNETHEPCTLYSFVAKPRDEQDEIPF